MSEVKVLHEWTDCGCSWSVKDGISPFDGDPTIFCGDTEVESGVLAREFARLAARVRELEAENEALKAAVRDAYHEFIEYAKPEIGKAWWAKTHPIVRSVVEKGGE